MAHSFCVGLTFLMLCVSHRCPMLPPVPCVALLSCSVSCTPLDRSPSVWTHTVAWALPSGVSAGERQFKPWILWYYIIYVMHNNVNHVYVCSVYSGHQSILVPPLELETNPSLWLSAVSQYKVRVTFCSYSVMEMCTKGLGSQTEALRVSNIQ